MYTTISNNKQYLLGTNGSISQVNKESLFDTVIERRIFTNDKNSP